MGAEATKSPPRWLIIWIFSIAAEAMALFIVVYYVMPVRNDALGFDPRLIGFALSYVVMFQLLLIAMILVRLRRGLPVKGIRPWK